jgi:diguanylate cyclase (GGDEF)-like protein
MSEGTTPAPPIPDDPRQSTPKIERRSPTRRPDHEVYHLSEAAIAVARNENPQAFESAREPFLQYARVVRKQTNNVDDLVDKLANFHSTHHVADSYDELTRTFDRRSIIQLVESALQTPASEGKEHVYIDIDVDGLKEMNERSLRKHVSADEALKAFASFHMVQLVTRFGMEAKIGRLSGDEFAVFIPNTTRQEVEQFFEEIEPIRQETMRRIREQEGLPRDITGTRAITVAQPGDTHESMHLRTDADLIAQKHARNQTRQQASSKI